MNAAAADDGHIHLPIGEDPHEGDRPKLQLLKRTLIEKQRVAKNSLRYGGNEFASNIPTFLSAATKGDAGYIVATACAFSILGIIGYRGISQRAAYNEALEIWSEFESNFKSDPENAYDILEQRMQAKGLLFSGIPEHNLQNFRRTEHRANAIKQGFWDDPKLTQKLDHDEEHDVFVSQSILDAYQKNGVASAFAVTSGKLYDTSIKDVVNYAAPKAEALQQSYFMIVDKGVDGSMSFLGDQIKDGLKNVFKGATYKDIGGGIKSMFIGARDFRIFAHKARERKRIRPQSPDIPEIRIEENADVLVHADENLISELQTTRADLRQHYKDGKIMSAALTAESGFCTAHFYEAAHAIDEGDWINLGVSTYSLMMASGAFAYLGRQVSSILDVVNSRRARMTELYGEIEGQVAERAPILS